MTNSPSNNPFYNSVRRLLQDARSKVVREVNSTIINTYFEIGKMIEEEEQQGEDRAVYGTQLIKGLSNYLNKEIGRGFSATNLKQMRSFYLTYSKGQTVSDEFNPKLVSLS